MKDSALQAFNFWEYARSPSYEQKFCLGLIIILAPEESANIISRLPILECSKSAANITPEYSQSSRLTMTTTMTSNRRWSVATALLVLLFACIPFSQAKEQEKGAEKEYCITRPEGERCYNVYSPGRVKGTPALLLEFYSSFGSKDDLQYMTDFEKIADDRGDFLIARPAAGGIQGAWQVGPCCGIGGIDDNIDDLGFVVEIIEAVDRDYGIDRKRIYSTGYSQGAAASHYLAYMLPEYIAAIATQAFPLSTPYFNEAQQRKQSGAPFRPVPVLSIHGYNDRLFW